MMHSMQCVCDWTDRAAMFRWGGMCRGARVCLHDAQHAVLCDGHVQVGCGHVQMGRHVPGGGVGFASMMHSMHLCVTGLIGRPRSGGVACDGGLGGMGGLRTRAWGMGQRLRGEGPKSCTLNYNIHTHTQTCTPYLPLPPRRLEQEVLRDLASGRLPAVQPFHAMAYPFRWARRCTDGSRPAHSAVYLT